MNKIYIKRTEPTGFERACSAIIGTAIMALFLFIAMAVIVLDDSTIILCQQRFLSMIGG